MLHAARKAGIPPLVTLAHEVGEALPSTSQGLLLATTSDSVGFGRNNPKP